MTDNKELKVVFAPGCFDDFEGTQEELNDLIEHIKSLAESGELFDEASLLDVTELDEESLEKIEQALANIRH